MFLKGRLRSPFLLPYIWHMTLDERKRQFYATLRQIAQADQRLIDCCKRASEQVKEAKSIQRLNRIDKQTSQEIDRICND